VKVKPFDAEHQPLNGFQVIEASAGCGKTYALSTLFVRLLTEVGIKAEEILVVTFTDAAAGELKTRIRQRIQDSLNRATDTDTDTESPGPSYRQKLREALLQMDNAPISTIHGFCKQTLTYQAFESGMPFRSVLEADTKAVFDEIACDFYVKNTAFRPGLFVEYLDLCKFGPNDLASLLRTVSGRRDLVILPDIEPVLDPSDEYSEAFFSAKKILASDREGLEAALSASPIDKRSYRRDRVSSWLDRLERILSFAHPTLSLINDDLKRFTSSAIGEKVRSGDPPRHDFIDVADLLVRTEVGFDKMLIQFKRIFVDESLLILARIKKERSIHTFDDLLQTLHAALEGPSAESLKSALRDRFKAVLIDEFQDTDSIQFDIFNRAFGGTDMPFFVIGDPKQSIYRFRGGDIFTYFRASRAACERRFGLTINWRSDPSIIKAVNTLFSSTTNPFLADEIPFSPVSSRPGAKDAFPVNERQGALEIRFVSRADANVQADKLIPQTFADREMLDQITADISSLLGRRDNDGSEIVPTRIAVLVRTNEQAKKVRDALQRRGISSLLLKEESVFETDEATEIRLLLVALQSPFDLTALRTVLSTRLFSLEALEIKSQFEDSNKWERWAFFMSVCRRLFLQSGMFLVLKSILELEIDGVTRGEALLGSAGGERAVTNYRHLCELIERRPKGCLLGEGLNLWFDRQCEHARDGREDEDDTELRIKSDAEGVLVLTMHKSKGLEFDIVFCPYLWHVSADSRRKTCSLFHDPKNERLTLNLSKEPERAHLKQERFEIEAENVRLAYVALTRARQRCIVVTGAFKTLAASPIGRLFHGLTPETPSSKTDEELLDDLKILESDSEGAIRVSSLFSNLFELEKKDPPPIQKKLSSRVFNGRIPMPKVTLSFTGLTSFSLESDDENERADTFVAIENNHQDREVMDASSPDPSNETAKSLLNFDRGAAAGTCLHSIFENLDFEAPDHGVVKKILQKFGYKEEWTSPLITDLLTVLEKPLKSGDVELSLSRISTGKRLNELSFLFPVRRISSLTQPLSYLFEAYCTKAGGAYAEALSRLSAPSLAGYMKGFVDLVFEYRGKYFIVDYKSNFLGNSIKDYHPSALAGAMAEHHYYLQYHLYTAALHRRLGSALKDYSYEEHFGGVFYLFIRGMTGLKEDLFGVFFDRPKQELIEGISRLFMGEEPNIEQSCIKETTDRTGEGASGPQLALPGFSYEESDNLKGPGKKRRPRQ
jgi:exodeoxyribonuclease V beta subunit